MDALIASAQIWVPAAGLAALLLIRAWRGALAGTAPKGAATGYFICFGLAVIAPAIAAVIAWSMHGGLVQWGPILLLEAADTAERHALLAALISPALVYLLARFIFSSADAIAYAAAAAGAFALMHLLPPPAILAAALAIGGLTGFADRMLGKTPMAMAGVTGFALLFGYVYAGGGVAIPLIVLSLVGGLCLSVFAAGSRAQAPLYMLLTFVPAFALAAIAREGSAFDLTAHMPEPAIGNTAALLVLFAVFPAVAAPLAILPIRFADRVRAFLDGGARLWAAPFAILVELIVGVLLGGVLALALTLGGALFDRLHEALGGATLLKMSALIGQVRPAPLAASNAWLIGLLVLPLAPALVHALDCATQLFGKLLAANGAGKRLGKALWQGGWGVRLSAMILWRALQLAPAIVIVLVALGLASFTADRFGDQLAQASDALITACDQTAHSVEDWRLSVAALCPTAGPLCR